MKPRRKPVQREKHEQAAIVQLLRSIGAKVYVLGTRRPRGDYHGTCQTHGIPDLYVFLPKRRDTGELTEATWIEVKSPRGSMSLDQRQFKAHCFYAGEQHIVGGIDAVIQWLVERGYLNQRQVPHYRLKTSNSDPATAATRQAPAPKVRADLAG